MKSKWALGLALLSVVVFASQGWASCDEPTKAAQPAQAADAAKVSPCGGSAEAKTASAGETKPCCKDKAAQTASAGETKPCCKDKAAQTASAGETKPCCKDKAAQTATTGENKGCCKDKAAQTATAGETKPCCKDKAALAAAAATAAETTKPCSGAPDAKTVAATETPKPCSGADAQTASATGSKPCCGKAKGCSTSKTWLSVEGPPKALLSSLPTMRYRVGDETLDCPMEAEKMALTADKPIQYVVGEKTYATKPEATVALAALLDDTATNLQAVQSTVVNTYLVAGKEFSHKEDAESVAKTAGEAAAAVKVSYKVGEDSFCCDRMAGLKAKETGKTITYLVDGEETCCSQTAKLLLAQAKVRAILVAASKPGC